MSAAVEVTSSHEAQVGELRVRRALPRRARRTVGAWCFADLMGPATVNDEAGLGIGPHPHIGLQTVTWLMAGEVRHRDSLGSDQVIRPGQLNLMTAGHGVSHAEEGTDYRGPIHGVQLWVAQPEATRDGAPAFEHHGELPRVDLDGGTATVMVGGFGTTASPARADTDHLGVDLDLHADRESTLPVRPEHEHAVLVTDGSLRVDGTTVQTGELAYLGIGEDSVTMAVADGGRARALLLGGSPFPETLRMWWNYVARTEDEIASAHADWTSGHVRFGATTSTLDRIDVDPPPWAA